MGLNIFRKRQLFVYLSSNEQLLIAKSRKLGFRLKIPALNTVKNVTNNTIKIFIPNKMCGNSFVNNLRKNVSHICHGYFRILICEGVGLRFLRYKNIPKLLTLRLGMAHPLHICLPKNISFRTQKQRILLYGNCLHNLITLVTRLLYYRPVDPYKARGFKLSTNPIKLKPGKQRQR
jgi:ribosomal protein L6P/L9E